MKRTEIVCPKCSETTFVEGGDDPFNALEAHQLFSCRANVKGFEKGSK